MTDPIAEPLIARFFRYLSVTSQSDASATALPSTPGQLRLAEMLKGELDAAGAEDVHLDGNGVLTARLPGTVGHAPAIGFVAHLDTVDVGLSPDIRPQRLRFEGQDLALDAGRDIWLRVAEHPEILPYRGEEIVFGDGTGVLGADNKAAVAILMTLVAEFGRTGMPRGDILLAFVPDEEIGLRGAKALDLARFPAAFAYTIDGGERGEVSYETFNAASARIAVTGITAHPVSAKGVLVNPILLATELIALFDPLQTPEHTAGRDGYWWFNRIGGDQARATLEMAIRDFDGPRFAERKRAVEEAVEAMRARHPRARFDPHGRGHLRQHRRRDGRGPPVGRADLPRAGRAGDRPEGGRHAGRHGRLGAVGAGAPHAELLHRRPQLPFPLRMPAGRRLRGRVPRDGSAVPAGRGVIRFPVDPTREADHSGLVAIPNMRGGIIITRTSRTAKPSSTASRRPCGLRRQ